MESCPSCLRSNAPLPASCVCLSLCPPSVRVVVGCALWFGLFIPAVCTPITGTTPDREIYVRPRNLGQATNSCNALAATNTLEACWVSSNVGIHHVWAICTPIRFARVSFRSCLMSSSLPLVAVNVCLSCFLLLLLLLFGR